MKNRSATLAAMGMLVAAATATGPSHAHEAPRLVEYLPGVAHAPGGAAGARAELSSLASETLDMLRDDPSAAGLQVGMANPDAVRDARALSLELPGLAGAGPAQVTSFGALEISERSEHDYSVYGRDAATQTEVSLVIMGQDVVGTVTHDDDTYDLRPLGGGLTAVYRRDHSRFPPGSECGVTSGPLTPVPRELGNAPKRGTGTGDDDEPFSPGAGASTAPADSGEVIDVLVAYTPTARTLAGNIDALIRLFFDDTNRYYANSLILPRVRLVHSYEVDYRQADDGIRTDLDRLGAHNDGYMDEIHAKRDRYGADLVALLIGRWNMYCGIANIYYGREDGGFSVTAQECGSYTFAHELGHNQGAHHDPGTNMLDESVVLGFPYGQGFCNSRGRWRTVMSYNFQERCRPRVPYFSNPKISYRGTPTGDEHARHNVRVINETAFHVANFRTRLPPRHSIPLVMSADNAAQQGFVRIINRSRRSGTVRIDAFDDNGRSFGPAYLSLEARETRHFNSLDLERGNSSKGLSGFGNGSGNWRLDLTTDLDIRTRAYVRTSDGFLTSIHEVAAEEEEGSMRYRLPTFNPGKNANQESRLRLINVGDGPARIEISGMDDQGEPASGGSVRLTLPAKAARMLSARELEQGARGVSGRLEAGRGKWQLSATSDQPLQVMSLLFSRRTGNLTNLSR